MVQPDVRSIVLKVCSKHIISKTLNDNWFEDRVQPKYGKKPRTLRAVETALVSDPGNSQLLAFGESCHAELLQAQAAPSSGTRVVMNRRRDSALPPADAPQPSTPRLALLPRTSAAVTAAVASLNKLRWRQSLVVTLVCMLSDELRRLRPLG